MEGQATTDMKTLCCGDCTSEERRISRAIEAELNKTRQDFKLLLLGTENVGKSTVLKQMRILHSAGFQDPNYRRTFVRTIRQNVTEAINTLLLAMGELGISFQESSLEIDGEFVKKEWRKEHNRENLQNLFVRIAAIWKDRGVWRCYRRRNEFRGHRLNDSAKYFLDQCLIISRDDYIPTEQDILRMRQSSTGIQDWTFNMGKGINFRVIDVGGQRTERRKWIHCFDNVSAIIFVAALSDYDQTLECRDPGTMRVHSVNRLRESLELFNVIIHERCLQGASLILFLNKTDVFAEKIQERHLEDFIPQYKLFHYGEANELGTKLSADAGQAFIYGLFSAYMDACQKASDIRSNEGENQHRCMPDGRLYTHYTCATDTEGMRFVMQSVTDFYMRMSLLDYNLA